mmetsp:Transcript_14432/g.23865  ORF Transcript_14432/g.23865 Transcript_14432/m.23865 type:complete len:378 (-) Transcript_14432:154-1287(-)
MRRRQRSFSNSYNMSSSSSMMRRRQCLLLVLSALTLHATVAYVVSPTASRSSPSSLQATTTDSPEPVARQVRILTPLSTLFSFLLPASSSAAAPASSAGFDSALKTYFPGALSSSVIALRVVGALRKRDYRPYNTLVASSICSDEINETPSSLVETLEKQLGNTKTGGIFHLGGLGGLPFVGVSGMDALLQHCPSSGNSDGKLVMIFGPHVGISESGQLGKLQRSGMDTETASCGAAMAAYQAISGATASSKKSGVMDFQEDYIIENLKKKLGTLAGKEAQGGDETIALVTDKMYDLVSELLKSEVDAVISSKGPELWESIQEVTLIGGIIVNRSAKGGGGEDYFQPLTMSTISSKGEDKSIYNEVFGDLLTPRKRV